MYTFTYGNRNTQEIPVDASNMGWDSVGDYGVKGYYGDNIIKPSVCHIVGDEETSTPFCLNNIVWYDSNSMNHGSANNIIIESECVNMTLSGNGHHIGYDNRNLIMGTRCIFHTFGGGCANNSFGDACQYNSFGNNCFDNTLGNACQGNSFGNNFQSNTLGIAFGSNTFGNNCLHNSFGMYCNNNSFGNVCTYNMFGNDCSANSFGNECSANSFGNGCQGNSFGNNCFDNTLGNYFKYNTLGNGVNNIAIPTDKIYRTQILNGTHGHDSSNKLTIAFTPETEYSQFAGFTSDGVLKIWVEADDPHDGIDCGNY